MGLQRLQTLGLGDGPATWVHMTRLSVFEGAVVSSLTCVRYQRFYFLEVTPEWISLLSDTPNQPSLLTEEERQL